MTAMATAAQTAKIKLDTARWLLRIGLASVYGYVTVESRLNPGDFVKYIPSFIQHSIPTHILFLLLAGFELVLTLWLLSGRHDEYADVISFLFMGLVIVFNLSLFSVLFRDIAIALSSLALAALDYRT